MKKTPWFDGSLKPVRDGVYERLYDEGTPSQEVFMCRFQGAWMYPCDTAQEASTENFPSSFQHLKWRGLTKPPKGQE